MSSLFQNIDDLESIMQQKLSFRHFLSLPAVIYMVIITQIPFLLTLRYSLERWNLLRPERRKFIWFEKYPGYSAGCELLDHHFKYDRTCLFCGTNYFATWYGLGVVGQSSFPR
jgi:ABC-type sugar transport system permease subunit